MNAFTRPIRAEGRSLEDHFAQFREQIVGQQHSFHSPEGCKQILYADWTASGRAYKPIEDLIQKEILPFVGNTHTGSTVTGSMMSEGYEKARQIIKQHVHATAEEVLLFCGSGMTAAVNKLQRILGLRVPERMPRHGMNKEVDPPVCLQQDESSRPVVFVSHMEHHSNHISWLETIATVEIIPAGEDGNVDLASFRSLLEAYQHRANKIAAITACSNVTGIHTPFHAIAKLVHEYRGLCFVDFACSAPYININMHPDEPGTHLDAIYFSMHKFLGGPATPGVLIFNKKIYHNNIPDQPGGGTVSYSNPWKDREYVKNIEQREEGGTPPFLQAMKAAMCVRLKESMGIEQIRAREQEMMKIIFDRFSTIENVELLEKNNKSRLPVFSFMIKGAHYNLVVKLLNDRFGIQSRGGCSCAGPYGHFLLKVDKTLSYKILKAIRTGDLSDKPGWVRLSFHPTMNNDEIQFIMDALEKTATRYQEWAKAYCYDRVTNEYIYRGEVFVQQSKINSWFEVPSWK